MIRTPLARGVTFLIEIRGTDDSGSRGRLLQESGLTCTLHASLPRLTKSRRPRVDLDQGVPKSLMLDTGFDRLIAIKSGRAVSPYTRTLTLAGSSHAV